MATSSARALREPERSADSETSFYAGLTVDQQSAVPIYYQLEEHIRDKIESGILSEGTRLPAERDIALHLGISRMTVRQAISRLASDGLLAAHRRAGTTVTRPRLVGSVSRLGSFSSEVRAHGRALTTRLLDAKIISPEPGLRRSLHVAGADSVIRIRRVRILDGEPVSLQTSFLPEHLCAPVLEADLSTGSLYEILREACGLTLAEGQEVLSATILDEWEAEVLSSSPGQPAFLLERLTLDVAGRPVEYVKSVLRGDRFTFEASLKPEEVGG